MDGVERGGVEVLQVRRGQLSQPGTALLFRYADRVVHGRPPARFPDHPGFRRLGVAAVPAEFRDEKNTTRSPAARLPTALRRGVRDDVRRVLAAAGAGHLGQGPDRVSSLAGITLFAIVAPALVAPILGWVVDRFRRRPFLIAVSWPRSRSLLPLLLVRERGHVWLIYAVAVGYGATMLLSSAALQGLIKELLPEELLAEANGALQTVRQGLRLVAPLGGAALFTVVGIQAVVGINVACLLIGAATLSALKVRETAPAPPEMHWLREVGAGLKHLFGPPALRRRRSGS